MSFGTSGGGEHLRICRDFVGKCFGHFWAFLAFLGILASILEHFNVQCMRKARGIGISILGKKVTQLAPPYLEAALAARHALKAARSFHTVSVL
jgi:hypothetical protein